MNPNIAITQDMALCTLTYAEIEAVITFLIAQIVLVTLFVVIKEEAIIITIKTTLIVIILMKTVIYSQNYYASLHLESHYMLL